MLISFSLCILLCSRFPFDTWTSLIIHLLCPTPPPPPSILLSFCFQLSWILQWPQENWRHCSCKILGGKQSVLRKMCKWRIMLFDLPEPYSCCLLQIDCPHYPGNQYKILLQLIRERIFIFSFKSPSPQMTSSVPREKTDHSSRQESLTMESLILPHPPALLPNHPLDFKWTLHRNVQRTMQGQVLTKMQTPMRSDASPLRSCPLMEKVVKFTFNVCHFEVAQCGVELYHGVVVGDELIHYPTQPRYNQ